MPGDKRVNLRATPELVEKLHRAAAKKKMSLTTFMLTVTEAMADRILNTDRDR